MRVDIVSKQTWMHKVNPSFKLIILVLLFIVVLTIHQLNLLVYLTAISLLLFWLYSGHNVKVKSLLLLPFFLVFASTAVSMILFGKGDVIWVKWGLIQISEESFYRGIHVGFRAFIFGVLGLLFTLSTRPVLLFYSLMQQLKLKPQFAYSFLAGFRMLPIIAEEFVTIRFALKVREKKTEKGIRGLIFTFRNYALPLLAQSIRRAHRVAVAMEAKGFSGNVKRTYFYRIGFSKYDGVFLAVMIAMVMFSYIASEAFPFFPVDDVRYKK
ncbi:energy-coupling factor transporter transmembrane protein EcfT [Bacillus haikouensis]|uniref:energy-coupling factor transporter transmembrane component T family protein n=1 Tax=Bacillus haikouensis TaxID=1510468 RepID=UPI001552B20F|nr:energy-coupling factor transporter transmembrane component T [Bacillus haikouensis]NQD67692.1 energy-coupling factor transporter transmembrane protein EcfT [Bacillus haikouensis]